MNSKNEHRLSLLLCLILVSGLVLITPGGLVRADDPVTAPTGLVIEPGLPPIRALDADDQEAWEWEVIRLVNEERASRGIPPLKRNDALDTAAYGHSQDMGVNDFVSHTGSNGSSVSDRVEAAGYTNHEYLGENIAAGQSSPDEVMYHPTWGWMNSDVHRENILKSGFREIGMGYYYDTDDSLGYYHYWTQDFGSRFGVYPVIINSEAYSTTSHAVQLYVYGPPDAQQMHFSNNDTSWSDWETYNTDKTWTLAAGSTGTRTVYVEVRKVDSSIYKVSDDIYYVATGLEPVLSVDPTSVTFLTKQGSGACVPVTHVVRVSNDGGGTLDWDATESSAWFEILPDHGTNTIAVTCVGSVVKNYGLGEQIGALTVTATGAQNSPQTVSATLIVVEEIYTTYLPSVMRNHSSP